MPSVPGSVPVAQILPTRPTAHPHLSHSSWTVNGPERQRISHSALSVPHLLPHLHGLWDQTQNVWPGQQGHLAKATLQTPICIFFLRHALSLVCSLLFQPGWPENPNNLFVVPVLGLNITMPGLFSLDSGNSTRTLARQMCCRLHYLLGPQLKVCASFFLSNTVWAKQTMPISTYWDQGGILYKVRAGTEEDPRVGGALLATWRSKSISVKVN